MTPSRLVRRWLPVIALIAIAPFAVSGYVALWRLAFRVSCGALVEFFAPPIR